MATHGIGNSVVKTISLHRELMQMAEERRIRLRFRSFSAYVQRLVEKDLDEGGAMELKEIPPPYGPKTGQSKSNKKKFSSLRKAA